MTPWLEDPDVRLYHGDNLDVLRQLPDRSVHMCATSPPFYGLRDYGTGLWDGGDPDCDHTKVAHREFGERKSSTLEGGVDIIAAQERANVYRDVCGKCGARRVDQQIGLEATPDQWVERLVEVFREVRRVLRDDGTLWVEIGDSYASQGGGGRDGGNMGQTTGVTAGQIYGGPRKPPCGFKPKDLLGQPWLLAFALRADGWYLRSEIIWARPNPMPESVTDRPTKSHSTVFLLSKQPRYFYDADAIREPHAEPWRSTGKVENRGTKDVDGGANNGFGLAGNTPRLYNPAGANARSVWQIPTQPTPFAHFATWPEALVRRMILAGTSERGCCPECGAPWVRDVYAETADGNPVRRKPAPLGAWLKAHRLAAGLSMTDLCGLIGAHGAVNHGGAVSNWEQDKNVPTAEQWADLKQHLRFGDSRDADLEAWHEYERAEWGTTPGALTHGAPSAAPAELARRVVRTEWVPQCECDYYSEPANPTQPVPCTVLDPFAGSATTMLVARNHGRHSIGIELNADYLTIAARRLQQLTLLA